MFLLASLLQGPELELIKLSRFIVSPIPLVAWVLGLTFILAGGFRLRNRSERVFKLFVVLAIVLVVFVVAVGAAPSFIASDASMHGVVINPRTQAAIAGAHVSVDGFPDLKYDTTADGNFQITIPKRGRQDEYTLRAQLNGTAGTTKIKDADARKTAQIELNVPEPTGSVTVNLTDRIRLRDAIRLLADLDNSTPVFRRGCPEAFLRSRLRGGELRANSYAEVMQQLSHRLTNAEVTLNIYATKRGKEGIYEITCAE